MSPQTPTPVPSSRRLHSLDAVRALALLAGLVLHSCMAYMPGAKYFWPMVDPDQGVAAALIFFGIHLFRMTLFFLIAGFFGRMLIERVGAQAFIANRTRRILLPLLVGWPLVMTAIVAALVLAAYLKNGGQIPPKPANGPKFTADDFPLAHLWFLYALVLMYCAALLLRGTLASMDRHGRIAAWLDRAVQLLAGRWAIAVLAMPAAIALWAQPVWYLWFGVPTPDQSLIPNVAACVAFGVAFAAGWMLGVRREIMLAWEHRWLTNLAVAVVAIVLCLYIAGPSPKLEPAAWDAARALYAVSYAVASWALTLGLIGVALRYLKQPGALLRYLADASYWTYLVHLPIVMAVQGALITISLPWWVKLPIVLASTMLVSLGSYQLVVRNTRLGLWLNGSRSPIAKAQA